MFLFLLMDSDKFITIPDMGHYQHYNDRNIVWLKFPLNILQDYNFSCLTNAERWIFIGLLMLAARNGNAIPLQSSYILKQISNGRISLEKTLNKLESKNLIAVKPLAECYQVASPKRKEEKREDKIKEEDVVSSNKHDGSDESKLEFELNDWNSRQPSPVENFKPINIIRKHGVEKVGGLFKEYGPKNNGFYLFLKGLGEY